MNLIVEGGVRCYDLADIEQELGPERFRAFRSWFAGQTGIMLANGRLGVFQDDYERFMAGKGDAEWEDGNA